MALYCTQDPACPVPGRSWAVAIQTDGKIVAAGYTPGSAPNDFMVARHLGAASTSSPPTIPDPVPVDTDITPTSDSVTAVAFQRDAVGDGVSEPDTDALFGYGSRSCDGTWTVSFATAGWVQAHASDAVFGDPFALPLTVL